MKPRDNRWRAVMLGSVAAGAGRPCAPGVSNGRRHATSRLHHQPPPESRMPRVELIAQRFRRLDFHDDTLVDLRVTPVYHREKKLRGRSVRSIVELSLDRYRETERRVIRFYRCTNLRVAIDFDVLADNLPPNTSHVGADTNQLRMRRLIRSQETDWNVTYEPRSFSPLKGKLDALAHLVSFRVQFFGGVIDVIARRYEVKTTSNRWRVRGTR